MKYHLLNIVEVLNPRWHDRVILPRCDKFKPGYNIITIRHHNYPGKYLISYKQANSYPRETKVSSSGDRFEVYVIPLQDLRTVQEHQRETEEILQTIQDFGW